MTRSRQRERHGAIFLELGEEAESALDALVAKKQALVKTRKVTKSEVIREIILAHSNLS